ncbi:MAG: bifunctional precorrin-2 dehydrogenase/sirohydrochlorin ferrochelatase [Methanomicrobiales archaeon]|nr:bifunctional precorrin-2 dehydrogenase/sirohydrochlorin ferrochelatase [Methanomicrobiales archaeon]
MIPLIIDFSGKKVVIFGGGEVAARKAEYFRDCDLVVISRSFSERLEAIPGGRHQMDLGKMTEEAIRTFIKGAFLVIAATSDQSINNHIGYQCRQEGVLFNNAAGDPGDVILPAILKGKNFLVAVETYGRSPAFSRYLRSQLESSRDSFDRMIEIQERLRNALKQSAWSQEERRSILRKVVSDPSIWNALRDDPSAAWTLVEKRYLV